MRSSYVDKLWITINWALRFMLSCCFAYSISHNVKANVLPDRMSIPPYGNKGQTP